MLMVRSFAHVRATDLGFDPANVLTARVELPASTYGDSPTRLAFWTQILERIESLPGVEIAGAARRLPLASNMGNWSITVEGREPLPGENPNGDFQVLMPGYFEAMGMELLRGRLLTDADHDEALPVVVVSEAMAQAYWPGEEAVGKRFRIGDEGTPWYEVVGVMRGMKHNTVLEGPRTEMYHTAAQFALASGVPGGMTLVIRTESDPLALAAPVRREIAALDPSLPVADLRTLREVVGNASADTRFATGLLTSFGCVALLLAATGIYGVVSYSVRRQTREIGIRMAIGADRSRVLRDVVRDSAASLALGLTLGVAGALALGGSIAGLLVGVDPRDPATYALVVGTVVVVTLLSAAIPARRATTVDPVVTLRDE
jgi:predicted permease